MKKINQELMNEIAVYMNDEIREKVHSELAPCDPNEFLEEYLELDPEFLDLIESEFKYILERFGHE